MNILLLDDEPFVLQVLAHQLRNLGCEHITLCERPNDALAIIGNRAGEIDLTFCDLNMPEMDGVEFVRHLVGTGYAGALVLVSGEDERILQTVKNLARAHHLNVIGALHKPVSPDQLRQVLDTFAAKKVEVVRAPSKTYGPDELRRAIAQGELINHYQPKVSVATGSVAGVETLVRWLHPQDGLVFPDQFIPVAEEHDLIDDLTQAVLSKALDQARIWLDAGLSLHLAVNVSMDNLRALDFPDRVAQMAAAAGLPLPNLVLEVTESKLMKDPLSALDILTRLRLKRIGLSIDDFGTGHSSLTQLRDIPFDELKLDRSFVHGAWNNGQLGAIFSANLNMAQHLGLRTVAEGVEDAKDWDFLVQAGCDMAQGYFIARPMPGAELGAWMASWRQRRSAPPTPD